MKKDFNTGLCRSLESERVKLTRRRRRILRGMGRPGNLGSSGIAGKFRDWTLDADFLNHSPVRKDEEIAVKSKENEARDVRTADFEMRAAALDAGAVKPVAKTGANSDASPSRDPTGVPCTQPVCKPPGRKSMGRKGHTGSTGLQSDSVTGTYCRHPEVFGPVCGRPPDKNSATVRAMRPVADIPPPTAAG